MSDRHCLLRTDKELRQFKQVRYYHRHERFGLNNGIRQKHLSIEKKSTNKKFLILLTSEPFQRQFRQR